MSGFPNLEPQIIRMVSGGAIEYTRSLIITALDGKDISAAALVLGLGSETDPVIANLQAPDLIGFSSITVKAWKAQGGANPFDLPNAQTLTQRFGSLYVGTALRPAVGSYWIWSRLGDQSEVIPRRGFKVIIT